MWQGGAFLLHKITSDGRKLGLDQRVINPTLPDNPDSKVNMCVSNIHRIWQDGQPDKLTQLVFCDLSTPKGSAAKAQAVAAKAGDKVINGVELHALERMLGEATEPEQPFTIYEDIREKLVARGIPREQIAFIHEANTEVRKKELFAKVRSGQVRVLMGSTFKMGAGMNVQDRLVALHDLDCPWRPGDLEQRSGRIIRQGNRNKEVHIYRYVTEATFDAYLWQTVENKQKFISQIMTSKSPVRSCEDIDETALSYAEIKAWLTVLFANFAEAIAEGRGKAQADSLRASKRDVEAHKIPSASEKEQAVAVSGSALKKGDIVIVKAGEQIPADGEVIEGAASVDESAITGESAPVVRESGGDRSAVTGGTTVLSDWLVIQITSGAGEGFLDKMIAMVEGASRKKTPNELALQIFLVALSIIFILVTMSLYAFSAFSAEQAGIENPTSITTLVALLVCLAPTTIGALLSAIGIAGMSRLNQANVLAMSGRAIEAAGDVDILMLDKTGTITLGNRQACEFISVDGTDERALADAAQLSSLADETPEGRSVVILAKERFDIRARNLTDKQMTFIPFTAKTRMSGVNFNDSEIRKGAADAIRAYVEGAGGVYSEACEMVVRSIASQGGTPLVVAENHRVLGVIHLKDIVKQGVKEKFGDLRKMGIKTIMITGDNPMTAAAIAAEAGVDDFLAEATPEGKLSMIRDFQSKGHLVAMTGDGTNDAPALAQADVAVAMNTGTQAAKEAGNMVDLDSSPTKLIDIVRIGKQLLMTRGSLTTFSIANDVAKYFAIIPALFMGLYPGLSALNIMGLHTPQSAILSAIIYNALIIVALIPLALKGVKYREVPAGKLLARNLLIYGAGGLVSPFVFVKLIDMTLTAFGL